MCSVMRLAQRLRRGVQSSLIVHPPARCLRVSPDRVTWVCLAIVLLLILLIDYSLVPWPYSAAPFYAIPVLIGAQRLSPRQVSAIAGLATAASVLGSIIQGLPLTPASFGIAGLLLTDWLALRLAVERQAATHHADAAEEAHQQLQGFLRFVVHELRAPLTTQWGYLQVLTGNPRSAAAAADATRILRRLTEDLTAVAQSELSTFSVRRTPMDLVALLQTIVWAQQATTTRHRLALEGPVRLNGEWDEDRLGEVVSNLIANAIKYSPAGGEIRVTLTRVTGEAGISVEDQGLGIAPEQMERLFQPYARLHAAHGIDGLGIGLSISKGLVEAHGGRIWVESQPGEGSVFSVALPLTAAERLSCLREGTDGAVMTEAKLTTRQTRRSLANGDVRTLDQRCTALHNDDEATARAAAYALIRSYVTTGGSMLSIILAGCGWSSAASSAFCAKLRRSARVEQTSFDVRDGRHLPLAVAGGWGYPRGPDSRLRLVPRMTASGEGMGHGRSTAKPHVCTHRGDGAVADWRLPAPPQPCIRASRRRAVTACGGARREERDHVRSYE